MASQPTSAAVAAAGGGPPKTKADRKAESDARRAAAVAAKATAKAALTRACESTRVSLTRKEFEENEAKAEAEWQALLKKEEKRPIKFDPNRLKFAMETVKMKAPPPAVKAVKDKASVERLLEVADAPSTAFETITIAKALEMEMQAEEAKAKAKKKKDAEDAAALAALLEKADFQEDEEDDEEDEDEEDEDDEEAEDDGYWDNLNKTKEEFEKNKVTKEREEVFKHHTEIMADIRELQALAENTDKESAV